MENLFKYAKKELSQDAFLLWVLSHARSENEDMRELARDFISFLTGKNDLDIAEIKLNPQWKCIDVVAEITLKNGDKFNIFIEDKTTSEEHNQLKTYNEKIGASKYCKEECFKIFYKTDMLDPDERQRVVDAKWKIIELDRIKEFWENCSSKNIIVNMYANRVVEIYDALQNEVIPDKEKYLDDRQLEMFMWKGFFLNKIINLKDKKIKPKFSDKCDAFVVKTNYQYTALAIKPKGRKDEIIPYIEIRDRDCVNGKYKAMILTYGMAENKKSIPENQWNTIQSAGEGTIFKKSPKGSTKQVLNTINEKHNGNADEFLELTNRCIDDYLKIMDAYFKLIEKTKDTEEVSNS